MRTKGNTGRLAALGSLALMLEAGCSLPGHAPNNPEPENVVSVGYGTQSQNGVAVRVSSVAPERDGDGSVLRVEDLLLGIPGVQVIPLSNGEFTVRIRTGNGLADAEPLLVIDDAQVSTGRLASTLGSIHPRDIVRIDVLKDVASTAVYGVKGANGVILVTTRRGR